MKKVLIIDDERSARELLNGILTDKRYDLDTTVVGEAADGIEAVELFNDVLPDIVLMDIDMPFKDGLTALREMQAINRSVKVIIVTGHNRFDYAHEALNSGASFLLLKPVNERELVDMIRRISSEIDDGLLKKAKWEQISSIMQENLPMLRRNFIKQVITGDIDQTDSFAEAASVYGVNLQAKQYFVACVSLEEQMQATSSDLNRELLAIDNITKAVVEESGYRCYSYINAQNRIIVLFCCTGITETEKGSLITLLQNTAENFAEHKLFWGIGRVVDNLGSVRSSYYGAVQALSYKDLFENNGVTDYRDIGLSDSASDGYSGSDIESIVSAFNSGDIAGATEKIADMYSRIADSGDEAQARNLALEMIAALRRASAGLSCDLQGIDDYQEQASKCEVSSLKELMTEMLSELDRQKREFIGQRLSKKIKLAKEYIESNYADPSFGLQTVSEYVSLSNAYFCSLFYAQVGMHFSEYLTQVRIEKAKLLLREGLIKIYEVALNTGFNDPKYFSSKFKKLTGVSPSEYREKEE